MAPLARYLAPILSERLTAHSLIVRRCNLSNRWASHDDIETHSGPCTSDFMGRWRNAYFTNLGPQLNAQQYYRL